MIEGRLGSCAALAALLTLSCRHAPPPASTGAEDEYPGILHPPSELEPDFVVEQHVEAKRDGESGGFDAVLQKRGPELVLVGLGPMGIRAFVLRQEGTGARLEQTMGRAIPFPPRNVLIDVHRAFFKRLRLSEPAHGPHRGRVDDEEVVETWQDGNLVERRFARADRPRGAVRVLYGPGCRPARCEPTTVRIVNEWFGYELFIENRQWRFL